MKVLITLWLLILSQFSFSQAPMSVIVTPKRPVDCKIENHRLVNWIYSLKTISEDSDQAVVQFITQYGQCIDGQMIPASIDPIYAVAYVERNNAIWPWQKNGVKTKLEGISDIEFLVTLTFNKKFLFKKQPENHLSFYFQPGHSLRMTYVDYYGNLRTSHVPYVFPWNVDVYLKETAGYGHSMQIQIH